MLSCGFEHCLALTSTGQVYSWGCGASGCLGHGDYFSYIEPKGLSFPLPIVYIECGGYHSAAIDTRGNLYTWGRNDVGQLGCPKEQSEQDENGFVLTKPKKVENIKRAVKVALGEAHTLVLNERG